MGDGGLAGERDFVERRSAESLSGLRLTTAPRESVISTSSGSPASDDFQSAVRVITPRCVVSPGR